MKLEEVINEIFDIYSCDNNEKFPYFLIVGAGVSYPEIPLASDIIKICKKKCSSNVNYDNWKKECECKNVDDEYSFWLAKAFPSKENRRQFFSEIILNAKITSSNFQIANILVSRKLFNLIITTNFDNQIEQSLNLLNFFDYYSSTNVIDNMSINLRSNDVQIVHVHSDYRNYDFKNLKEEIAYESVGYGILSMKELVVDALKNRSPIIIGYSGWENDLIMTAIKERLSYDPPYKYYWFCYNQADYDKLPSWLKDNHNVTFIVPEGFKENDQNFINDLKNIDLRFDVIGLNVLPAHTMFSGLRTKFQIASPDIFDNPLLPCENLINHISKYDKTYKLDGLFDEYKELVKVHQKNKDIVSKIKQFYNDSNFEKLASYVIRNLGKNSTISDADLAIVMKDYVLESMTMAYSEEEKIRLLKFVFRMPLYRNIHTTRMNARLALELLIIITKNTNQIAKYKKLYSYFEGTDDIAILTAISDRFNYCKNTDSIVQLEYSLANHFFNTNDIASFYMANKFFPQYAGLVMYMSMKNKDKSILVDYLIGINKEEYKLIRKDKKIRRILKGVLEIINEKNTFDDPIFEVTKVNFN